MPSTLLCGYRPKSLESIGKNFVIFFQRNCLINLYVSLEYIGIEESIGITYEKKNAYNI